MLLSLKTEFENRLVNRPNVLVDTEAQANLISRMVVPDHLTWEGSQLVRLLASNGQVVPGGSDQWV